MNMGNFPTNSVIILIVFIEFIGNDAARVRFTNVVCFSENKTIYPIHKCRLKAVQRDKVVFNYNSTLYFQLNDMTVHAQMVKRANGYKPWLYNLTFNGCDFLRKRNHPFLKMVYNIFKDNSNINRTCPYKGPVLITDLYLKPGSIPLPMPSGEYGLLITVNFNNLMNALLNLYLEIVE